MKRILAIVLAALALAACQREAPAPATSETPTPAATIAGDTAPVDDTVIATETTAAQSGIQPGTIDGKAFAGKFTGTLPCADCPGIDETLELGADGRFTLTDVYRERPQGTATLQGTWSIEADGKRLRLDPGNKTDVDRLFAIDDDDMLTLLGADGERAASGHPMSLQRNR